MFDRRVRFHVRRRWVAGGWIALTPMSENLATVAAHGGALAVAILKKTVPNCEHYLVTML